MICLVQSKACERCGGDLSIECDVYGIFIECIQCGATWNKSDLKVKFIQTTKADKAVKTKPLTTTIL